MPRFFAIIISLVFVKIKYYFNIFYYFPVQGNLALQSIVGVQGYLARAGNKYCIIDIIFINKKTRTTI